MTDGLLRKVFRSRYPLSTDETLTRDFVRRYVGRRMPVELRPTLSVSDLVQSVMMTALRKRDKFRGQHSKEFQGWVARIAERKIIDAARRYRGRCCPPKFHTEFLPSDEVKLDQRCPQRWRMLTEEHQTLILEIQRLPPLIQQIVLAKYRDGQTFENIGRQLGLATSTCRRRWFRGLQLLANAMDIDAKLKG